MAAKRKYHIQGTKDFLVLGIILFFICLWAIKDAWFPSPKVVERHPHFVEVAFPVDGTIREFHVSEGDPVRPPNEEGNNATPLVSLDDTVLQKIFDAKKEAYTQMDPSNPERAAVLEEVVELKEQIAQLTMYCPKLGKEESGSVKELLVNRYQQVEAGEPVMVIQPSRRFYIFNKSLAIFCFVGFSLFFGLHFLTS